MFCISSDTRWQLGPNKSVRMEKRAAAAALPERKKKRDGAYKFNHSQLFAESTPQTQPL
jgi:hypothetical protein